ncbi:type 1 glutamine amidotransferase [Telluribacter sp.]|jgi:GMP synthase-like glutamine amidotransferase|uniref:type 1 glutamine amidotransferase n=1 Tax=Telluribacter sp. TaxID=1978767 RepID=UPI002E0F9E73|nr:GMP synthase [Telluribacter sp.]
MNIEKQAFRIAVLDMYNGVENEGMRCIKQHIEDFGLKEGLPVQYQVFDVRQHHEVPDLSFDAYISTGGPGSPMVEGTVWERRFFNFLDQIWAHNANRRNRIKKPLFLICHSFQMACVHWQIGSVGKRRSTSFGTFPVHMTRSAHQEPLFSGLNDPFWVVDSREYQVIQPNHHVLEQMGAKVLCLEKIRPHVNLERAVMAIRFSKEIVGTQFHPEADAEGMLRYFLKEDKKANIVKNHGLDKYNAMIEHLNDPDKILLTGSTILPGFLSRAAQRLFTPQQV